MRNSRLSLVLCLVFGCLFAGPALAQNEAQNETPKQAPSAAAKDQDTVQGKAQSKAKILLLETDHAAEEAKESLQGESHDRGDSGHGGPSSGFGGLGPSHGSGPSPHR
ncbi:MAG: hypothetical protein Q7I92_12740 [Humidesulfovibrio sp.]|nr:hypothetical protein [Humidesulfovibrio sp.]